MGSIVIIPFLLIVLLGLLAPVTYGLFNQNPMPLIAVPALIVVFFASLGGLHAWGESQAIGWTIGYSMAALVGLVAAMRQFRPREVAE